MAAAAIIVVFRAVFIIQKEARVHSFINTLHEHISTVTLKCISIKRHPNEMIKPKQR